MVARATGAARSTVTRGVDELDSGATDSGRVRRAGAGRKRAETVDAELAAALERLVDPDTRGDPESPLRWTIKSTRQLSAALTGQGHRCSEWLVRRLLHDAGYSLQATAKQIEGAQHPDRDAQFGYLNDQVREHHAGGAAGDQRGHQEEGTRRAVQERRPRVASRTGDPQPVKIHDFPDKELGKAIPYGVYDIAANTGWVSVGTDHDTAAFAVATIRRWWQPIGADRYPHADKLLITADAGGSNGYRIRLWKTELAALAAETGLAITVCHLPPGTSNRVGDWRGDAVRAFRFQPPPPRFRACGSPAHGSPTSFTTGIRLPPPVPEGPGGDDVPRKADQAQMVRGGIGHHVPSEAAGALVAFADEQRHPHPHVLPDHPEVVC